MNEIKDHTVDTYWIARSSDNSIIRSGVTSPGLVTTSGQNVLETFTDEQEWENRLTELGATINE